MLPHFRGRAVKLCESAEVERSDAAKCYRAGREWGKTASYLEASSSEPSSSSSEPCLLAFREGARELPRDPTGDCEGEWEGEFPVDPACEPACELRADKCFAFCLRDTVLPLSSACLRKSLSCMLRIRGGEF